MFHLIRPSLRNEILVGVVTIREDIGAILSVKRANKIKQGRTLLDSSERLYLETMSFPINRRRRLCQKSTR